jgi:copper chaperone CopZ
MSSPHCIRAVFTALTPVEGIVSADVTPGSVVVEHDGRATVEALREAIAVAGYDAVPVEEERRRLPVKHDGSQ